jgi:1-acyl-sn-glycerol-3-phosphate acyltransferase
VSTLTPAVRLRAQLNRVVALLAAVTVLPSVAIAEKLHRGAGRRVALGAIRRAARLCGVRFVVHQRGRLEPGGSYVLVPNHSSPLDIPAVLTACEDVRFLAAAELFRIPLLAGAMRALGTEPIDRRHPAHAYQELAQLAAVGGPRRLAIFAEGGIAPAGQRLPFKNGAFVLAIETGSAVVPVAIHGTADLLAPHARFAIRPGTITVELLDPIPTSGLTHDDREGLRDRVQALVLERLAAGPPTLETTGTTG